VTAPERKLGLRRPTTPWYSGRDQRIVGRLLLGRRLALRRPRLLSPSFTLVAIDVDPDAGVAAIWVAHDRADQQEQDGYVWLYEHVDRRWIWASGSECSVPVADLSAGRAPAGQDGQIGMMDVLGSCGSISLADRRRARTGDDISDAAWVGCTFLRVAAETNQLLVGQRQITVPHHGCTVIPWKASIAIPLSGRPGISAIDPDGTYLSVLGPHDYLDSFTWARLAYETEG
jgi:hypothetical protein